jgi:hypothetical protein
MNKLEEKFRPIVYPFIGSSFMTGDESEEVIKMNVKTCTEITTDAAVKFAEFIKDNYEFYDDLKNDRILWNLCGTEQKYTSEQLFQEFINNHY